MFEKASRMKLRFNTNKGIVSTEDLWDFSLIQLNEVAISLFKEVESGKEKSFISKKTEVNEKLELAFDVVRYIINVKLVDKEVATKAANNKIEKDKLLAILSDKEDESLRDLNVKDLKKMIKKL